MESNICLRNPYEFSSSHGLYSNTGNEFTLSYPRDKVRICDTITGENVLGFQPYVAMDPPKQSIIEYQETSSFNSYLPLSCDFSETKLDGNFQTLAKVENFKKNANLDKSRKNEISSDGRPSITYKALIAKALDHSKDKSLLLREIYDYVVDHYKYYANKKADKSLGWKNSIRHNLSLEKEFFEKVPRPGGSIGRGSHWRLKVPLHEIYPDKNYRRQIRKRHYNTRKFSHTELKLPFLQFNSVSVPQQAQFPSQWSLPHDFTNSIYPISAFNDINNKVEDKYGLSMELPHMPLHQQNSYENEIKTDFIKSETISTEVFHENHIPNEPTKLPPYKNSSLNCNVHYSHVADFLEYKSFNQSINI